MMPVITAVNEATINVNRRTVRSTVASCAKGMLAGISGRNQRLAAIALGVSGACFILGTFFAIITNHPIF